MRLELYFGNNVKYCTWYCTSRAIVDQKRFIFSKGDLRCSTFSSVQIVPIEHYDSLDNTQLTLKIKFRPRTYSTLSTSTLLVSYLRLCNATFTGTNGTRSFVHATVLELVIIRMLQCYKFQHSTTCRPCTRTGASTVNRRLVQSLLEVIVASAEISVYDHDAYRP